MSALLQLGYPSHAGARVWARNDTAGQLSVVVDGQTFTGEILTADNDYCGIVDISGLKPDTRYTATVYVDGASVGVVYPRTAPMAGSGARMVVFTQSCFSYFLPHPFGGIIADSDPVLLLDQGDHGYFSHPESGSTVTTWGETFKAVDWCDSNNEAEMQAAIWGHRRAAQRQMASCGNLGAYAPMIQQTDDHEKPGDNNDYNHWNPSFIANDASFQDNYERVKAWCRTCLRPYFKTNPSNTDPLADPELSADECQYFRVRIGDAEFFCLEEYDYRSPPWVDPAVTVIGSRQKEWLFDSLAASDAVFKVISIPDGAPGFAVTSEMLEISAYFYASMRTWQTGWWMHGDTHLPIVQTARIANGAAFNLLRVNACPVGMNAVMVPAPYGSSGSWTAGQNNQDAGGEFKCIGRMVFSGSESCRISLVDPRGIERWGCTMRPGSMLPTGQEAPRCIRV